MKELPLKDGCYRTDPGPVVSRDLATLMFYPTMAAVVCHGSFLARYAARFYGHPGVCMSSRGILVGLEAAGVRFDISGLDNVMNLSGPCVVIGNHMSVLETLTMPAIIGAYKDVTFVIKKELATYPVFRYLLMSMNPIVVSRTNPREDLTAVLTQGSTILAEGRSLVIFPQSSRSVTFDPKVFNTIGIKLALRANVPVIPLAIKTDVWGNGKRIKDFGAIDPAKTAYFAFGQPIYIKDRGIQQHQLIIEFITEKLKQW
ncbi:MAG: 1-acyl-sn-glycerol-3-phosphate acyltransferase [Nitrospirae bacterium]|uniref:lysophospholipid acyltransferase family protein n=1 Tax=Candidatus Magnetobacterium casense TaxID=1455061 RepID=UPI0006974ED9|nr:lysophospholipid acyltransferase family protein [Candidatus Magnetobacterium casensis]MBF0336636.1 1-acyl-sn-glycerol-3-phosphate acyltransferase [Nitrospirota bacterium]